MDIDRKLNFSKKLKFYKNYASSHKPSNILQGILGRCELYGIPHLHLQHALGGGVYHV
jgi:hypothetical protein